MDDDDPGPPHSEPLSKKPKISVHKCPEKGCSAQFCRRAKLNEHLRVCHGGEDTRPEARFACPSCESSFYNSSQLREHYDIHELACKCRSSKCMKTGKKKVFHSMSILASHENSNCYSYCMISIQFFCLSHTANFLSNHVCFSCSNHPCLLLKRRVSKMERDNGD